MTKNWLLRFRYLQTSEGEKVLSDVIGFRKGEYRGEAIKPLQKIGEGSTEEGTHEGLAREMRSAGRVAPCMHRPRV